jgi:hypothetical protein
MSQYVGWCRWSRDRWQAVAEADTSEAAYRQLLAIVRQRGQLPVESAVLPVGTHPAASKQDRVGS